MKVLVVEDNPVSVRLLKVAVTNKGFTPIIAEDGPEALEIRRSDGELGLVLCDLQLPTMSGFEVVSTIKKRWDVPVIMVTGAGDPSTIRAAIALGCDDFLLKPVDTRRLGAKIDAVWAA